MTRLFEAFFVARLQPGAGDPWASAAPPPPPAAAAASTSNTAAKRQRSALFCRFSPPGGGTQLPADDNLSPFCWPLGAEGVRPSPFLVTAEYSFTRTGALLGVGCVLARRARASTSLCAQSRVRHEHGSPI